MKIAMITAETQKYFKSLIPEDVYSAMNYGEPVFALGLMKGKTPIGALTGQMNSGESDIFTVSSLYVKPEYRRRMGGMLLVNALQEILDKSKFGAAFYTYVEGNEDTDMLGLFWEALDAGEVKELEHLYSGSIGALLQFGLSPEDQENAHIKSFEQFTESERIFFRNRTGRLFDSYIDGEDEAFTPRPELSFVRMENGRLLGYLTAGVQEDGGGELFINLSSEADMEVAGSLLGAFAAACAELYPPETEFILPVVDDRYEPMFEGTDEIRNIQHTYIF